jgi:hypothetical protein
MVGADGPRSAPKVNDTDRKKSASCGRLKSAGAAGVFFIVSLAKFFSNRFLRCLV